jgi:hypothetical protein
VGFSVPQEVPDLGYNSESISNSFSNGKLKGEQVLFSKPGTKQDLQRQQWQVEWGWKSP